MSYLGLDIGTSGCKAAAFDIEGNELAYSFREYKLLHPKPNWAELDPDVVFDKCCEVISEVNTQLTDAVVSMSVSSQGEAFTPVGKDGKVLGNVMVSSDARADKITKEWSNIFGKKKLYEITGHTPHPLFTLYKLLWIKQNQPDVWEKAKYFLCFEDFFHFRMGLTPKISWGLAGRTLMFDVTTHQWSDKILDSIDLKADRLAIPSAPGEINGTINNDIGARLGFKNPVQLVSGGHDQTCAALGAGVTEPGLCMYATGTVDCFCPVLEKPRFSDELQKNNLCCYDYTIKGRYTSVAFSLTGGSILKWIRDEFCRFEIEQAALRGLNPYSVILEALPDKPTKLLVLPYFSASGTPYFEANANGAIIGLKDTTTKGEFTKALLEGVAMEMKLNLYLMERSGMKIDSFVATGGGTRNKAWTQLKSDIQNRDILVSDKHEAGCYGAAMLACSAVEKVAIDDLIKQNKSTENQIFTPNAENVDWYNQQFELYKQLYPSLKKFWK